MTPEFPYVQMPGAYRGFFRKASLWEGIDHVLSVSGTRFNDEYRRFYYRDIQAVIVEKRPRTGSLGWWIILILLLILAIAATVANDQPNSWVGLVVVSLVVLIRLEIALRRSCRCSIQTAVSREPLPSLLRRENAEQVISRLQTRIAAEQGELPAEIAGPEEAVSAAVSPPDSGLPTASQVLERAAKLEASEKAVRGVNYAVIAMFVLLLNSVFTFWISSGLKPTSSPWTTQIGYGMIAVGLIPITLALQNLARLRAVKSLRILLIGVIVLSALRVMVNPILAAFFSANRAGSFAPIFNRYYVNINGGLQLAVAAGGIILIFAKWETYRRGELSSD